TFVCEFGVVEVTVTNLSDKTEIPLSSLMEFWFSDSEYYKDYGKHIYSDEENINWIVKVLDHHFMEFKIQYPDKISEYVEFQKLESKLIKYINSNGSELLKEKFNNNSSDWKELAINEMDKNYG
ncbi:hypothetical protein AB9K26_00075, partial [Psychroserpens sp. XS_ASV72]|uniref:hypothetical protein n=1 Tax=Psychroserpens sp. XS_ASV72 TaxID=3241293 RepID=UPI003519484F